MRPRPVVSSRTSARRHIVEWAADVKWTRGSFIRKLVASVLMLPSVKLPALAAYTVVPTGDIGEKQARLAEVERLYATQPDDPYVFGEKAQLEFDIAALKRNQAFVQKLRTDIEAEKAAFLQRVTLPVDDMDAAVNFWRNGMGALVQSTRLVDGTNVTVMGFGPQTLRRGDGGKFSLELVGTAQRDVSRDLQPFQYIQLSMPVFRLSQVMAFGGQVESAYGWTALTAPGGVPLRVSIDETRRDPFQFVAVRVSNMKAAIRHYEAHGMTAGEPFRATELDLAGTTFYKDRDALEPDREVGSVLMSYGDPSATTGILLLPPRSRKRLLAGPIQPMFRVVGKQPLGSTQGSDNIPNPDGISTRFMGAAAFEDSLAA